MTWALFIDTDGKPKVDFFAFARGRGIISEHEKRPDAEAALRLYRATAEEEAKRALGQKEFDFARR